MKQAFIFLATGFEEIPLLYTSTGGAKTARAVATVSGGDDSSGQRRAGGAEGGR